MPKDKILPKLQDVKQIKQNEWMTRCPCHQDDKASLHITELPNGQLLIKCHAGCNYLDILGAIGLNKKDLYPPQEKPQDSPHRQQGKSRIVAVYDYKDTDGNLIYQSVRYEPKDFRQRRPDGQNGWIWNLQGVEPLPYRLPELLNALGSGEMVLICEGERDVENLLKRGFTATTNHGGAGKWKEAYSKYFPVGSRVTIIPDNDEPGRKHAQQIAEQLQSSGCQIKLINLPGLPEKGDASDWFNQGHTAEELQKIIETTAIWGQDPWELPIPFNSYELPPFPVEVLPDWLRNFAATVAIATQTPTDMAGLLSLTMVGACVSRSFKVMARLGWVEPVNLYSLIVLAPGNRKSAVVAEIVAPLQEYESELVERMEPEYRTTKAKREAVEQALSIAKSTYAKARTANELKGKSLPELEQAIEDLSHELSDTPEPSRVRLVCDDITIERLAGLMAEQGGAIAMFTAEGGFVGMMAGRYSQGQSNFDIVLKAHSGEEIRVDRINREPEFIKSPALSLAMAVQPAVLTDLTSRPEFRGKGLNARFLYAIPDSNIGNRTIDPPAVPEHVRHSYKANIKKLLKAAYPGNGSQSQVVSTLILGDDAKDMLREFETWLEPQLAGHGELGSIQDWASKLAGAVVRITGILYIAKNIDNPLLASTKIGVDTISAAITIGQYLICHAKKAFDLMGANEDRESALDILDWIKSQGKQEFTRRDVYCAMHNQFKKATDTDPSLNLLIEHGYIKETESKRKDQRKFSVNPIAVVAIDAVGAKNNEAQPLQPFLEDVYNEKSILPEESSWESMGRVIEGGQS
jgi:DNA primase (bacterial type)